MQINPREYFTLARGLEDHTDSSTYYVRAVIRNGKTDAVIDTVNLTDNGNRRFTAQWQAPADVSGNGTDIIVTYTVYTNSGYTTKAENYGEKFDEHLVLARITQANVGGGGALGGADIDYKKIRTIIEEVIMAESEADKSEEPTVNPLEEITTSIATKLDILLKKPSTPVDFSPIVQSIVSIKNDLAEVISMHKGHMEIMPEMMKKFMEVQTGVISKLDAIDPAGLKDSLDKIDSTAIKAQQDQMLQKMTEFFSNDMEKIISEITKVADTLDKMPYITLQGGKINTSTPWKTNLI